MLGILFIIWAVHSRMAGLGLKIGLGLGWVRLDEFGVVKMDQVINIH